MLCYGNDTIFKLSFRKFNVIRWPLHMTADHFPFHVTLLHGQKVVKELIFCFLCQLYELRWNNWQLDLYDLLMAADSNILRAASFSSRPVWTKNRTHQLWYLFRQIGTFMIYQYIWNGSITTIYIQIFTSPNFIDSLASS